MQKTLDDLVDRGYVHRADITDHIMQALEGGLAPHQTIHFLTWLLLLNISGRSPVKHLLAQLMIAAVLQSYQMQMHSQLWIALGRVISAVSTTKGLS